VIPCAPRYNRRIFDLVRALDDRGESIAEICRRVGREAERLGLTRPSYVHLRRVIQAERQREDEIREIVDRTARKLVRGLRVDPCEVAERLRDVGR
jgi:hypothetical protein